MIIAQGGCHTRANGWMLALTFKRHRLEDLAGRQGFEPRYRGPEPRVLPLDDLPVSAEALPRSGTVDYIRSKTTPASAPGDTGSCTRGSLLKILAAADHLLGADVLLGGRVIQLPPVAGHAALASCLASFLAGPLVSRA